MRLRKQWPDGVEDDRDVVGVGLRSNFSSMLLKLITTSVAMPSDAGQRRQRVIGTKDEARAVDQEHVMRRRRRRRGAGRALVDNRCGYVIHRRLSRHRPERHRPLGAAPAFARALLARPVRRRHDHPGLGRDPAGPDDGRLTNRREQYGHSTRPHGAPGSGTPAGGRAGRRRPGPPVQAATISVDLDGLERGHRPSGKCRRPAGRSTSRSPHRRG